MTTFMRVARIGSGTSADPYRCPLPTYNMIADLGAPGWIVSLPDEDVPAFSGAVVTALATPIGQLQVVTGLSAADATALTQRLNTRYPTSANPTPKVQ